MVMNLHCMPSSYLIWRLFDLFMTQICRKLASDLKKMLCIFKNVIMEIVSMTSIGITLDYMSSS